MGLLTNCSVPCVNGNWVEFVDYEAVITAKDAEIERLKAEILCPVCLGEPINDRRCACNGTAKLSEAYQSVIELLYEEQFETGKLRGENASLKEQLDRRDALLDRFNAKNEALVKMVERLSAPISDEEMHDHSVKVYDETERYGFMLDREGAGTIIATRVAKEQP